MGREAWFEKMNGNALGRSRAGDGDVGIAVCHLEHADRAENERARQRRSQDLRGALPDRDVAEHPRDDPPALERSPVLAHRLLGAGAARDVGEALRRHGLACCVLEPIDRDGHRRVAATRAADVDLELALAPDTDGHGGTLTACRREST